MFEKIVFLISGLILISWLVCAIKTLKFGPPFAPMEPGVVERVMELAEVKKGDVFYDLGSGDGRLVIAAALRGARAYGLEINRLLVWYSRFWLRLLGLNKRTKIIQQDFFKADLSQADIVCLYLLPATNQRLISKLQKELKPGAKVITYAFPFEGWQAVRVKKVPGMFETIYLYQK